MTDKQIIVNDLSCDNCPEAQRCQEQRAKKEYAINQVLQDIPSEYTNVITRLRQIIPSITRCDYVLEKQLKHKEQECKKLKNKIELLEEELSVIQHNCNREGCKYYDDDTFKVFYECKARKALQLSANSVTTKYCDLLKTLAEIKEIVKYDVYTTRADLCLRLNWIKKKISECEVGNDR